MQNLKVLVWALFYLLALASFSFAQANTEEIVITTYYPSPYGVYKHLRIYPTNACPAAPNDCNASNKGLMFYSGTFSGTCGTAEIEAETLYYCNGTQWVGMKGIVSSSQVLVGTLSKSGQYTISGSAWETVNGWTASGPCAATDNWCLGIDLDGDGDTGCNGITANDDCTFGGRLYSIEWGGTVTVMSGDPDADVELELQYGKTSGAWGQIDASGRLYDEITADGAPTSHTIMREITFFLYSADWRRFRIRINKADAVDAGTVEPDFYIRVSRISD